MINWFPLLSFDAEMTHCSSLCTNQFLSLLSAFFVRPQLSTMFFNLFLIKALNRSIKKQTRYTKKIRDEVLPIHRASPEGPPCSPTSPLRYPYRVWVSMRSWRRSASCLRRLVCSSSGRGVLPVNTRTAAHPWLSELWSLRWDFIKKRLERSKGEVSEPEELHGRLESGSAAALRLCCQIVSVLSVEDCNLP